MGRLHLCSEKSFKQERSAIHEILPITPHTASRKFADSGSQFCDPWAVCSCKQPTSISCGLTWCRCKSQSIRGGNKSRRCIADRRAAPHRTCLTLPLEIEEFMSFVTLAKTICVTWNYGLENWQPSGLRTLKLQALTSGVTLAICLSKAIARDVVYSWLDVATTYALN